MALCDKDSSPGGAEAAVWNVNRRSQVSGYVLNLAKTQSGSDLQLLSPLEESFNVVVVSIGTDLEAFRVPVMHPLLAMKVHILTTGHSGRSRPRRMSRLRVFLDRVVL